MPSLEAEAPLGATFSRIDGYCARCGPGRSFRASLDATGSSLRLSGCAAGVTLHAVNAAMISSLAHHTDEDDGFPDRGVFRVGGGGCVLRAAQLLDYLAVARPAVARSAGVLRVLAGDDRDPARRQDALDALRAFLDREGASSARGDDDPSFVPVVTETGYLRLLVTRYDVVTADDLRHGARSVAETPAMARFLSVFLAAAHDRVTGGRDGAAIRFGGGDVASVTFSSRRLTDVVIAVDAPWERWLLIPPAVAVSRARSVLVRERHEPQALDPVVEQLKRDLAARGGA